MTPPNFVMVPIKASADGAELLIRCDADPRFKPGTAYRGVLFIGRSPFIDTPRVYDCVAYAACSSAGGRMIVAADPRADAEFKALCNESGDHPTVLISGGEYVVGVEVRTEQP